MRNAIVRLVFLMAVAVAGSAAWAVWLSGDEPSDAPPAVRLYAVEQDAIVSVKVATDAGEAAFERGPEGWRFASEPLLPVNLDRWGGIVLLLSGPNADRTLPDPADPAEYGLDAPSTASVGLVGGDSVTVRLGADTPDGRHTYAKVEGQPGVALVNAPWGGALARLVSEPPWPYWFYRVPPSLVRVFEAEGPRGAATFLLGLSGAESARVVVGETARDLDAAERAEVMRLVGGPPDLRLLPLPDGETIETLGFAEPAGPVGFIRLSYELAAPLEDRSVYSAVYAIGGLTPDGDARYALTAHAPALLAFDEAWVSDALALAERHLP